MARDTDIKLQNQVIYSVYLRAHTEEGTFRALIPDLDRIKALGADIIWLMPIHPIGVKGRKGSLGCPYANRDYRTTNPAYGSMEDFKALADAVHSRGMKLMIDVVYNHTSPDSVLLEQHPDFFWRDSEGKVGNKIGDWADVIDLDYDNPGLWDYQLESLRMWAKYVDGFRCDVASFVNIEFWKMARALVKRVRPGCIWLAETVHRDFGSYTRRMGFYSCRDTEAFDAFDMEYEYDVREAFDRYMRGETPLSVWLDQLNFQEAVYPVNYNKLRFLENHDQPRIASLVEAESDRDSFTALLFFLKGTTMLYGGQEFSCTHRPSLFEREVFPRTGRDISAQLRHLSDIKHRFLGADDDFWAKSDDENDIAILGRENGESRKLGVFPLRSKSARVPVDAPDSTYENLLDGATVTVEDGKVLCEGRPIIFTVPKDLVNA